ncbi:MAG TPA: hypothetical protein VGI16_11455 [Candidatus Acidoferrum sp.]
MRYKILSILVLTSLLTPMLDARKHDSKNKDCKSSECRPIVVTVRRVEKLLTFQLEGNKYLKKDMNYELAELKMEYGQRPVVAILEEGTLLTDVQLVPEMAVNAGFTDIRVYAAWPKTGHMAEVLFGPVVKLSNNPRQ